MANNMISIKIEGEEEQLLQFALPNGETFGGTVVNGLMEDHQFTVTDEIASLLGNPSSESLTMYKSEPMEQEEDGGAGSNLPGEGSQNYGEGQTVAPTSGEFDDPEKQESSSSSSSSDDDNSSATEGDNDSSPKSDDDEIENRSGESGLLKPGQQRKGGNEKILQQFNRRKRFKNDSERRELEQKVQEVELEKSLEHFAQGNIEDYLNRRGFRHPMTVPTTISKGIFASIILPETARLNTITYAAQYDPQEVPEEVERFWEFYLTIKGNFPKLATELKAVLVPMLLHFFQDLSSCDAPKVAAKLCATFSKRFFQEDRSQDAFAMLTNLVGIITSGTFQTSEYLATIRHREFRFLFSEALFYKVKNFLVRRHSPVLIHLFTSKFVIQLKETAGIVESFLEPPPTTTSSLSANEDDETGQVKSPTTKITVAYSSSRLGKRRALKRPENIQLPPEFKPILFDKMAQERLSPPKIRNRISPARKAIYNLRNSVEANIPSISLYTLNGRPISAAVSIEGTLLAFGMSTSVINVCFTTPAHLRRFNMDRSLEKLKARQSTIRSNRKRSVGGIELKSSPLGLQNYGPESPDGELNSVEEAKMINKMNGHEGPVYDLLFHPKSQRLFSVGHDTTLRAWDLQSFKCRCVYRGHASPIWCMDITDTGHMIVTGSMDTTARIWLIENSEYVRLLAGHYLDVNCVKFHPNEAYVATGSLDKSVRLWSIADGNLVRVFTGATSGLSAIAFHESGKYIIGGGEDSFIRIWNIAEGESLAELPSPVGSASACRRIALCQNMLAAGFEDNSVRIWNLCELFGGNQQFNREVLAESSGSSDSELELEASTVKSLPEPSEENDRDSLSSCSITEDELEPVEANMSNTAVRLPAPKIVRCDSSSILRLYYQDFGHLYTLGSKVEREVDESSDDVTTSIRPISIVLPIAEEETEPGINYLPETVRSLMTSAGITRWPIPVERISSSSEDEDTSGGNPAGGEGTVKNNSNPVVLDPAQVVEMHKLTEAFMRGQAGSATRPSQQ